MIIVIIVSIVLSVAVLIAASLLPYFLFRSTRHRKQLLHRHHHQKSGSSSSIDILSLCNCFACGIFISTCLLALIPHARISEKLLHDHLFGNTSSNTTHDNISFMERLIDTQLMILIGFLGILLTEQSIFLCLPSSSSINGSGGGHSHLQPHSHPIGTAHHHHSSKSDKKQRRRIKKAAAHFTTNTNPTNASTSTNTNQACLQSSSHHPAKESEPLVVLKGEVEDGGSHDGIMSSLDYISSTPSSSVCSSSDDNDFDGLHFRSAVVDQPSLHHQHQHHHHGIIPVNGNNTQVGLLLLAMSSHSIFEGIALGAMNDTGPFLRLLFTIMLHEVLCSFAYGMNLSGQESSTRLAIGSSIFLSCSIPFGMVIMASIGTLREGTLPLLLRFSLEGFSCGIFIYVACVEMLAQEFHHAHHAEPCHHGFIKALTVIGGASTAFFINVLFSVH